MLRGDRGWICRHDEKATWCDRSPGGEHKTDSVAELPIGEIDHVRTEVVEFNPLTRPRCAGWKIGVGGRIEHDFINHHLRFQRDGVRSSRRGGERAKPVASAIRKTATGRVFHLE